MKKLFLITFFVLVHFIQVYSQTQLSEKHIDKLNTLTNPQEKLSLYRKYYKKDSTKQAKEQERYFQFQIDSLTNAVEEREKALANKSKKTKDGVGSKIYKTVYKRWARRQAQLQLKWLERHGIIVSSNASVILIRYFEDYFLNATQDDATLAALKQKIPNLELPKSLNAKVNNYNILRAHNLNHTKEETSNKFLQNKYVQSAKAFKGKAGAYQSEVEKYQGYNDVLSGDSLRGFVKVKGEELAMQQGLSTVDGFGKLTSAQEEVSKLKAMPGQYQNQVKQMSDSAYIKEQARKKAEEFAMKYVAEHPELLEGARRKMNLLMKKYSVIPNSNDLSTAVKRNSLKGKRFKERLYFAGNFQLLTLEPVSIDFSPAIGYRINKRFTVGAGGNYRQSFGDSLPKISPQVVGYKAFVNYDIVKSFFLYGEFDRNSPAKKETETINKRVWKKASFVGVGKKVTIHPKLEMTAVFMYNLLHENNDIIYPKRWSFKIGFQTTTLTMVKPKPTFK